MPKPISVTYVYFNLPPFVEELRKQRGEDENVNINDTIIILAVTIIESVISDLLIETIVNKKVIDASEKEKYDKQLKKITNAGWNHYNGLSLEILGKKLCHLVDNEQWDCIKTLFKLRNQIVHGNPIIGGGSPPPDGKLGYPNTENPDITSYLIKKRVITKENPAKMNTKIADFFWKNTKEFLIDLAINGMNDENEIVSKMLNDVLEIDKST